MAKYNHLPTQLICRLIYLLAIFLCFNLLQVQPIQAKYHSPQASGMLQPLAQAQNAPLGFIENVGQFDRAVKFQLQSQMGTLWVVRDGLWLTLTPPQQLSGQDSRPSGVNIKITFQGISPNTQLEPFYPQETIVSYIQDGVTYTNVPGWRGIRYTDIYPGFDLELLASGSNWAWQLVASSPETTPQVKTEDTATQENLGEVIPITDLPFRLKISGADILAVERTKSDQATIRLSTPAGLFSLPNLKKVRAAISSSTATEAKPEIQLSTNVSSAASATNTAVANTTTAIDKTATENTTVRAEAAPAPLEVTETETQSENTAPTIAQNPLAEAISNNKIAPQSLPAETSKPETTTPTPLLTDPLATAFLWSDPPSATFTEAAIFQPTSNLVYSAFLGGSGNDCFPACFLAVDRGGNVYLTGHTASADLPTQAGLYEEQQGGGDIFIAKLNLEGNAFDYATFIGGSSADYSTAIAVDGEGNAYVAGYTRSQDFPLTDQAVAPIYQGGFSDAFVLKLTADGRELAYATYLGGDNTDRAHGLAVSREGYAYITGETHSANFPTTPTAMSRDYAGDGDAFLVKLTPNGRGLTYATLIGGKKSDQAKAIALDILGHVYLTGKTTSPNFPISSGALFEAPGGLADAFALKIDLTNDDTNLIYSTYLGGSRADQGNAVAVDSEGNLYLAGSTVSADYPVTEGAIQAARLDGYDAFITKFSPNGDELVYSTFIGGNSGDRGYGIAVDSTGSAYLTGETYSADFPITPDTFDTTYNEGYTDAFIVKTSPDGSDLLYATFLGGSEPDFGSAIAVDGAGNAYLTGGTQSASFPTSVNSLNPHYNQAWDGFITKLDFGGETRTALISGVLRDQAGNPIPDAVISAGASGSTTSDANGVYVLIGLDAGAYTISPIKAGYTFSPPRRTVNVPAVETSFSFVGVAQGDPPEPFLSLPVDYDGSVASFVKAIQDTDDHGLVTSWFDHAYPNYGKNGNLILADGYNRLSERFNLNIGCFEGRCYDGHDGIDLVYRDFRPSVSNVPWVNIRAAAEGVVVSAQAECVRGDRQCGWGFGNYVVLDHQNGYYTLYGHLASVQVNQGDTVGREQNIGIMGTTGNSTGFHLHFGLYHDDGNGQWDASGVDKPVDPFGWFGDQPDPWVVDEAGPVSVYLWEHSLNSEKSFVGRQGTTVVDTTGNIELNIPANALSGQANVTLNLSPAPLAPTENRSAGQSFEVRLLEWLPDRSTPTDDLATRSGLVNEETLTRSPVSINPDNALAQPVTLNVFFDEEDVSHLDTSQLQLHRWDETGESWQPLPSSINQNAGLVTAQTGSIGLFDLQAPRICATDIAEPDDNYYAARALDPDGTPLKRVFDTPDDEDWFYFEAFAGDKYILQTTDLGYSVHTILEIYDVADGLVVTRNSRKGPQYLEWIAPRDGVFFVRITRPLYGYFGCESTYSLRLVRGHYKLYMPLMIR